MAKFKEDFIMPGPGGGAHGGGGSRPGGFGGGGHGKDAHQQAQQHNRCQNTRQDGDQTVAFVH